MNKELEEFLKEVEKDNAADIYWPEAIFKMVEIIRKQDEALQFYAYDLHWEMRLTRTLKSMAESDRGLLASKCKQAVADIIKGSV